MADLYALLRVDPKASDAEIRAAYRVRALETHPDKGGSAQEFQRLQAAAEVLTNHDRRREYDRTLAQRSGRRPRYDRDLDSPQGSDRAPSSAPRGEGSRRTPTCACKSNSG